MEVKIIPTGDFALFRRVEPQESWCRDAGIDLYEEHPDEEKSKGPREEIHRGRPCVEAEVVAVGPGTLRIDKESHKFEEVRVKTGDRVLLSRWVRPRREILIDGKRHALTDSYSIMAILEKENNHG